jgi:protein-serine/threonine kinase
LLHQCGHIRLTDFDLAKIVGEKNLDEPKYKSPILHLFRKDKVEEKHLHQLNSFVGTPEYIAPEIITGHGYSALVDYWALGILIFEMLYGCTPFRGVNHNETFGKILNGSYNIPQKNAYGTVSRHCRDLMRRLVCVDIHHRLGHKNGAAEIKLHPFFKGINFNNLINQEPPITPKIKNVFDTRHFSGESQELRDDDLEKIYSAEEGIDKLGDISLEE